jgi:hypothetical protein
MKIYVASSWRNIYQQDVVRLLRACGHEVYDFRNPPGKTGFSWSDIDPEWKSWTAEQYAEALRTELAVAGHQSDMSAIIHSDATCLVLPSGRSASWELGYAMALGHRAVVYIPEPCEPELMYLGARIVSNILDLPEAFL